MKLRQRKFADQIRDIIASSINKNDVVDSSLSSVMITRVKVTSDLQLASIYFRFYAGGNAEKTKKGFERNKSFFRKLLASELVTRRVPELRFFYDDAQDKVDLVESLLHKVDSEK